MPARYAIIIPACNEEPCLGAVLDELRAAVDLQRCAIVVGVNASTDASARIARAHGALVAETPVRGYGHGCVAAITLARETWPDLAAFIFFAADGANDPADIAPLIDVYENGCPFVLGSRTGCRENWPVMSLRHVMANRVLGLWCALLTGSYFRDLGPLRIIDRALFQRMQLRELTYGWTIEAQIRAVEIGARYREISVRERRRMAGEQKVSRVSCRHSLMIGLRIIAAAWRARFFRSRYHRNVG